MHRHIFLLLFVASSLQLFAQRFGANPSSLKWKQVNTDTARVIFPAGLEKQALDISGVVHQLARTTVSTIGGNTRKINIVLQNQTTIANGYVALGPYRSEFFLTPRQNNFELGSLPWHKTLALHEYRHVQQFNNYRKGLSRAFYYVFGEQGQAVANSLAVPDWFFEGDAVAQETIMSAQGRGRVPYFFNPFRSLWASGKNYSWMKLRNGSLKDMTPDHYRLGYMMVTYGREQYGADIWYNITGDAAAFRGLFYPFQKAVKRHTGENYVSFRNAALNYFEKQTIKTNDTAAAYGRVHKDFVADEEFPQWLNDSSVVYVKSSFKKIPAFYSRNIFSGEETKIRTKDISADTYFSLRNGKIVYAAYKPDARWGWRNYGTINILDAATGEEKMLTHKTKYFSPDISPNGKQIVAVYYEASGQTGLHVLDASTGSVITGVPNKDNLIFTHPKFYSADSVVSAVRNTKGEIALASFDIKTGNYQLLTPFTMQVIDFPQTAGDTITFTMTRDGQDRLFAIIDNKTYLFAPELKNTSTGNYNLAAQNGKYTWMMFTAAGFHTVTGSGLFSETDIQPEHYDAGLINNKPVEGFTVSNYKKSYSLFNFHSWRPYIADPEYSYSLIGENILNTFQSELFFTYNRNEKFKETGASFAYGGWFPIVRAGGSYTFDRSFIDSSREINWNELNVRAGVSVPLTYNSGTFTQSLNFSGTLNRQQVYYTGAAKALFENKDFNFADFSFSFLNQQIAAPQNINPKLAQVVSLRHRVIINKYTAYQFLINGALYFPGFFPNHSIVLQGAYQFRDTLQEYNFSNTFNISRGYSDLNFPRMWRAGINYHFPIIYPDAGFANIVYLLRVRGNAFYDYSRVKSLRTGLQFPFRSAGLEVYFDSKWWNQLPVSFGIRYARLLDEGLVGLHPNQWEFVLPLTLLGR